MFRNRQNVEFVIHDDTIFIFGQRKQKPLVKSGLNLGKSISPVSLVHVHGDGVELLEAGHGPHEEDHYPSPLDRLDGPAEQVGSNRLEILQNEHLVGIPQDLVGLLVVGIPDLVAADEQIERIIDTLVVESLHLHIFNMLHPLLLMTRKLQIVFVAPKHLRLVPILLYLGEHVMEIDYLVASSIPHDHQHRTLLRFMPVLQQSLNSTVYLFLHC